MKIRQYVIDSQNAGIAGAIGEIMALFDAKPAVELFSEFAAMADRMKNDILFVTSGYLFNDCIEVTTKIFFWKDDAVVDFIARQRKISAADDSEPDVVIRLIKLNILEIMREITGWNPGPWGILRGVRPGKIVHRWLDSGCSRRIVPYLLAERYGVDPDKAELLSRIAATQRPFLLKPAETKKLISVYIGIPYCPSRCLYCSFPAQVLPGRKEELVLFLTALQRDILDAAAIIHKFGFKVETIYVGGGTPTSLPEEHFSRLLSMIQQSFVSEFTCEFTVEAGRPDSINDEKLLLLQKHGVTRVSVNPQSMQQKTLKHIGRRHSVQDIIDMFQKVRNIGIPVINMDIIAGLPGETEEDMASTIRQIAALQPENLTVHTLAIKRGSILKENMADYRLPDESVTKKMLDIARIYAQDMGMHPYYLYRQKYMTGNLENVGYARPGTECVYNIQVIAERQVIIGIGPAAGTKVVYGPNWRLVSCYNAKDVNTYINNLDIYLDRRNERMEELFRQYKED